MYEAQDMERARADGEPRRRAARAAPSTGCTSPARATCAARTSASSAPLADLDVGRHARVPRHRAADRRHPRPAPPARDGVEVPRRLRRGDVLRVRAPAGRGRPGDDARAPRDDPVGQGLSARSKAVSRRPPSSATASIRTLERSPSSVSVAIWLAYAGRSTTRQSIGSGGTPAARASRRARRSASREWPKAMSAPLVRRELLAEGRADGLPHRAARRCRRRGSRPPRGSSGARRRRASRSRPAPSPSRPCATSSSELGEAPERALEGRPVVHDGDAAEPLAQRRRRAGPTRRRSAPRRRPRRGAGPGARRNGTELASSRCRAGRRACSRIHSHSSSWTSSPPPGRDVPPGARVDDHQPRVADVAREAPAAVADLASLRVHPRGEQLRGVAGRAAPRRRARPRPSSRGREVAEVLEDPVGHQPGADVVVEPRLGVHLVQPALRDPPLGVDLVVVEDHRHRDRREQPADRRARVHASR